MDIMQGDSYPVYITLTQDGQPLTPNMLYELEVCVSTHLRKLYTTGEVLYDSENSRWYIRLTQEETLGLPTGVHSVICRIKYLSTDEADVKGVCVGTIKVYDTFSEEVL